jgi:hypothetical protein
VVVKYGGLFFCRLAGREFSSSLFTLDLHFLKGTQGVKRASTNNTTGLYSESVDMNHCSSTGFCPLSSFSIVCLIPIVSLCEGWSRLSSIYSPVQVPAGLLYC